VVAEDDVVLAAELAEEGRPGDPRGLRDLLDGGRFEALRGEQVERRRDDGVAGGGGAEASTTGHNGPSIGPAAGHRAPPSGPRSAVLGRTY
jgi:hypothetical protein